VTSEAEAIKKCIAMKVATNEKTQNGFWVFFCGTKIESEENHGY
jgi:hypothetical protein